MLHILLPLSLNIKVCMEYLNDNSIPFHETPGIQGMIVKLEVSNRRLDINFVKRKVLQR